MKQIPLANAVLSIEKTDNYVVCEVNKQRIKIKLDKYRYLDTLAEEQYSGSHVRQDEICRFVYYPIIEEEFP